MTLSFRKTYILFVLAVLFSASSLIATPLSNARAAKKAFAQYIERWPKNIYDKISLGIDGGSPPGIAVRIPELLPRKYEFPDTFNGVPVRVRITGNICKEDLLAKPKNKVKRIPAVLIDLTRAMDGSDKGTKRALLEIHPSSQKDRVQEGLEELDVTIKTYIESAQVFNVDILPETAQKIIEKANSTRPGKFKSVTAIRPNSEHRAPKR